MLRRSFYNARIRGPNLARDNVYLVKPDHQVLTESNCNAEKLLPRDSGRAGITYVWGQLAQRLYCRSFSSRQKCNQGDQSNRVSLHFQQNEGCAHDMSNNSEIGVASCLSSIPIAAGSATRSLIKYQKMFHLN